MPPAVTRAAVPADLPSTFSVIAPVGLSSPMGGVLTVIDTETEKFTPAAGAGRSRRDGRRCRAFFQRNDHRLRVVGGVIRIAAVSRPSMLLPPMASPLVTSNNSRAGAGPTVPGLPAAPCRCSHP